MVLILEQIFSKEVHIQISLLVSPKVRHLWRTLETDMLEQALQNNLLDPSNFAKLDASLLVTRCSKAFLPNGGRELYLASALRKLCVLDSDPCIPWILQLRAFKHGKHGQVSKASSAYQYLIKALLEKDATEHGFAMMVGSRHARQEWACTRWFAKDASHLQ